MKSISRSNTGLITGWRLLFPALILSAGAAMLGGLRVCIKQASSPFEVERLLQPDLEAWGILLLIGIASITLYALSESALTALRRTGISLPVRIALFLLTALISIFPGISEILDITPLPLALLGFSYLLLFDLFLDYRDNSLSWTLVWILFFAATNTTITQKYRLEKDFIYLGQYVQQVIQKGIPQSTPLTNRVYPAFLSGNIRDRTFQHYFVEQYDSSASILFYGIQPINIEVLSTVLKPIKPSIRAVKIPTAISYKFGFYAERAILLVTLPGGKYIYAERLLPGYTEFLPLFALFFLSLFLLSALLAWTNRTWKWLPPTASLPFYWGSQFRNRIQRIILGTVVGVFLLFTLIAIPFFRLYTIQDEENRLLRQAFAARSEVQRQLALHPQPISDAVLYQTLTPIAIQFDLDLDVYTSQGKLAESSTPQIYQQAYRSPQLPGAALKAFQSGSTFYFSPQEYLGTYPIQNLFLPLTTSEPGRLAYLGIPFHTSSDLLSDGLRDFLSAMLMVSVFLLLVSGSIAMFFAHQLTEPLAKISQRLRNFKIGASKPLEWNSKDDEIGELITAYNEALQLIETSAEQLRQSEREKAWREMAKQVAHEIKNPLTPMKLSIQYLLHAFQQDPARIGQLLPKAAATLSEQIDGLAQIATEFSNFAQMPQANNQPVHLIEILSTAVDLFKQQENHAETIRMEVPDTEILVLADSKQLLRVFNNLLQNALQAIPTDRTPEILVRLVYTTDKAVLLFRDNGTGIPEPIQEKVFSPNFTTKSSGMGLGLAICRNIIHQTGGQIYFQTKSGQGTDFYIELPLLSP